MIWALGAEAGVRCPSAAGARRRPWLVYVIILVAFQVFLITVAVEAFLADDEALAWATAAVSVVLAGGPPCSSATCAP